MEASPMPGDPRWLDAWSTVETGNGLLPRGALLRAWELERRVPRLAQAFPVTRDQAAWRKRFR
jgi:hypothetical protein